MTETVIKGIDTVAQALKLEDFPCDKAALYYSVGDIEIESGGGQLIPVRDVLDHVQENEFSTARDALQAICRAADRLGRKAA